MKKITHNMIIMACAYGMPTVLAMEINQPQEASSLSQDVVDPNEQAIIVVGGASYGNNSVTGRACVVKKRKELKKVRKGDILVAHDITSLWYGELSGVSGIIVEKGDENSHALALGKKLNIPVIVGAIGATKSIIDGQMITCDPITRNVYHVAYPNYKEFQFDVLHMPQKDNKYQNLHDELVKIGNVWLPDVAMADAKDYNIQPTQSRDVVHLQHNTQQYKLKRITKDVYFSHFKKFKEFVLSEKTWFERVKWWGGIEGVEAGARNFEGYDPFAVDCICIGESFMESSKEDIIKILQEIGQSERYLAAMDRVVDRCSGRPGDMNGAALQAYLEHIDAIDVPADVKKEDLMKHPREYKKIEDRVDKNELKKLVATGYFVRYLVKKKLLTKVGVF